MQGKFDVLIVGVFGRGQVAAQEFRSLGYRVAYVDASLAMGATSAADWAGPFPYWGEPPAHMRSFLSLDPVEGGTTVWTRNGPTELSGPLRDLQFRREGVSTDSLDYVFSLVDGPTQVQEARRKRLSMMGVLHQWPAFLAHELSAVRSPPSGWSLQNSAEAIALPCSRVAAPDDVAQRSFDSLRSRGITVYEANQIDDLSFEEQVLEGVEISGATSGVLGARVTLWFLSHQESLRLRKGVAEKIYTGSPVNPLWNWVPVVLQTSKPRVELESLPAAFLMVNDFRLPWALSNFSWVQKLNDREIRQWFKMPARSSLPVAEVQAVESEILKAWNERIPVAQIELRNERRSLPETFRFPVFSDRDGHDEVVKKLKGLFVLGPTLWRRLGWAGLVDFEVSCVNQIKGDLTVGGGAGDSSILSK